MNKGKIHEIIGPVIDIKFKPDELPELMNAIEIKTKDGGKIVAEVAQHKG
ncbi:MAG: F0F1 ATP synthase subunit beta, partial [Eubacterium sp.]